MKKAQSRTIPSDSGFSLSFDFHLTCPIFVGSFYNFHLILSQIVELKSCISNQPNLPRLYSLLFPGSTPQRLGLAIELEADGSPLATSSCRTCKCSPSVNFWPDPYCFPSAHQGQTPSVCETHCQFTIICTIVQL
jgi:hypothetical protein